MSNRKVIVIRKNSEQNKVSTPEHKEVSTPEKKKVVVVRRNPVEPEKKKVVVIRKNHEVLYGNFPALGKVQTTNKDTQSEYLNATQKASPVIEGNLPVKIEPDGLEGLRLNASVFHIPPSSFKKKREKF
jgi:hypothetical protein